MKRNETILVYAVTVMLLVILLVAVVFGESKPAKAANKANGNTQVAKLPGIDELLDPVDSDPVDKDPVDKDEEQPKQGTPIDPKGTAGGDDDPTKRDPAKPGDPDLGTEPVDPDKGGAAKKAAGPVDLAANIKLSPEKQIENLLGTSSRMGADYRVVKGIRGDSLRTVVARWCGDVDKHLADAEALNETLVGKTLDGREEVVVPWIEPAALLAVVNQPKRAVKPAKRESVSPVVAAKGAKGAKYTLKKGDSLWALAKSRVGENRFVPAWIERFKQLNPEITDVSVLVAGQRVQLPK